MTTDTQVVLTLPHQPIEIEMADPDLRAALSHACTPLSNANPGNIVALVSSCFLTATHTVTMPISRAVICDEDGSPVLRSWNAIDRKERCRIAAAVHDINCDMSLTQLMISDLPEDMRSDLMGREDTIHSLLHPGAVAVWREPNPLIYSSIRRAESAQAQALFEDYAVMRIFQGRTGHESLARIPLIEDAARIFGPVLTRELLSEITQPCPTVSIVAHATRKGPLHG